MPGLFCYVHDDLTLTPERDKQSLSVGIFESDAWPIQATTGVRVVCRSIAQICLRSFPWCPPVDTVDLDRS